MLPSDLTPIDADELLLQVVLEVGQTYTFASNKLVATPQTTPRCTVTKQRVDGTTYELSHGPGTEFSVNPGGEWNGLSLSSFSGNITEYGVFVKWHADRRRPRTGQDHNQMSWRR